MKFYAHVLYFCQFQVVLYKLVYKMSSWCGPSTAVTVVISVLHANKAKGSIPFYIDPSPRLYVV